MAWWGGDDENNPISKVPGANEGIVGNAVTGPAGIAVGMAGGYKGAQKQASRAVGMDRSKQDALNDSSSAMSEEEAKANRKHLSGMEEEDRYIRVAIFRILRRTKTTQPLRGRTRGRLIATKFNPV